MAWQYCLVVRSLVLGMSKHRFESSSIILLLVWCLESHLTSLSLSFLIGKTVMLLIIAPAHWDWWQCWVRSCLRHYRSASMRWLCWEASSWNWWPCGYWGNRCALTTWCSLPSVGVVTFLGRSSGDRFIGLEWNIPEYGFFEDDKSGVKRDIVRSCKPSGLLSMKHKLSEDKGFDLCFDHYCLCGT